MSSTKLYRVSDMGYSKDLTVKATLKETALSLCYRDANTSSSPLARIALEGPGLGHRRPFELGAIYDPQSANGLRRSLISAC